MSFLSALAPIAGAVVGNMIAPGVGGALVGGMIGSGVGSAVAQDEANKQNVDLTRETNSAQVELANTAHQREVADLRLAGLNPILSAKYGGSATPGLTAPSVQSLASVIQNSASAVRDTSINSQNLIADLALKKSAITNNSAQAVSTAQDARRKAMENDILEANLPALKLKGAYRSDRPAWIQERGIDVEDAVGSVLKPVVGLFK